MKQHDCYDAIILGAGAAGLFCAVTAARRGRSVLVLEKSNKPGKKILMSGGGRCNFTNLNIEFDRYLSANPHFFKSALSGYTQHDFIALVEQHAIAYHEKHKPGNEPGQLFCDDSSKQILNMLLQECESAGVTIRCNEQVSTVEKLDHNQSKDQSKDQSNDLRYRVTTTNNVWQSRSLVIATGGLSIPTLGGSDFGYRLAEQFGLDIFSLSAGLVPFTITGKLKSVLESLAGNSLLATVTTGDTSFQGNILFTHRGLSGPAMLQLSNYWNTAEPITINLMPNVDALAELLTAKAGNPKQLLRNTLNQYLSNSILQQLLLFWLPELFELKIGEVSDKQLRAYAGYLNQWTITPAGTEGYRTAEVTRGGVDTRQLSSKTMECTTHPGLFFIGEVVDVTGHLGGFNFQWAWSSGYAAGNAV